MHSCFTVVRPDGMEFRTAADLVEGVSVTIHEWVAEVVARDRLPVIDLRSQPCGLQRRRLPGNYRQLHAEQEAPVRHRLSMRYCSAEATLVRTCRLDQLENIHLLRILLAHFLHLYFAMFFREPLASISRYLPRCSC